MSGLDLNSEEFDSKGIPNVFNEGNAGVARNVRGSEIVKKAADDTSQQPDYKLIWKDSKDAEINMGIWYINEATETDKNKVKFGAKLKHLVHCYLGEKTVFPKFNNYREMTDWCMAELVKVFNNVMVRLLVTYGTTQKPKAFIQVRSYVPFIEAESIPMGDTKLKAGAIDQMTRLTADAPPVGNSTTAVNNII